MSKAPDNQRGGKSGLPPASPAASAIPHARDDQRMIEIFAAAGEPVLSVIIPAYNEARRLPPYLAAVREHLHQHYASTHEVIVVDDGGSDHLGDVLKTFSDAWPALRVIRHPQNLGKGAAVRTGIMAARGRRLLYADADGATPIQEEEKLSAALEAGADLAVGSRLLDADDVVRHRTWRRAIIGRSFAAVARLLLSLPVQDTQCGFKMLRAEPGKRLFELSRETGYLFDLEILALAQRCGYQVAEIPIHWADQPGSRLNMRQESRRILGDLWRVRRRVKRLSLDYDKRVAAHKIKTSRT